MENRDLNKDLNRLKELEAVLSSGEGTKESALEYTQIMGNLMNRFTGLDFKIDPVIKFEVDRLIMRVERII